MSIDVLINIQRFYVPLKECGHVFCMYPTTHTDCSPTWHELIGFYN